MFSNLKLNLKRLYNFVLYKRFLLCIDAKCNAESPLSFVVFMFAPLSIRIRPIFSFAMLADLINGVNPARVAFFLSHQLSRLYEQKGFCIINIWQAAFMLPSV